MSKSSKHSSPDKAPATDLVVVAKTKASHAADGAVSLIGGNPLAALLGGIALGAAAGALIPRGEREKQLLAPLGERLADAARAAVAAGREAGGEALSDTGLTVDGLREQVAQLFTHAAAAATAAGGAALAAAREKATG